MFSDILRIAWRSMTGNPTRTLLTMLGVSVGIAAVIALMAIGEGQKAAQLAVYEKLGTNRITVRRGWTERSYGSRSELTLATAEQLYRQCDLAVACSPVRSERGVTIRYLRNSVSHQILGTLPDYFAVESYSAAKGRLFTANDVTTSERVALLGHATAEDLFGARDPLGEIVRINGKPFTVIGVLAEKGALPWMNLDEQVVIPVSTYGRTIESGEEIDRVVFQSSTSEDSEALEEQLTDALLAVYPMFANDEDLFFIRNSAEQQQQQEQAANLIQSFLTVVGGIALFIGGIGIMNIMLVTVSERTPEIGLRKAIGATPVAILSQFLFESLFLCFASGAAGVGIALYIISALTNLAGSEGGSPLPPPLLNGSAIVLAAGVSAAVAIVFGLLPAVQASRLDPIHALRYE